MGEKSKILIIGGTGYFGKFIVEASAKSGHPTYALIRETTLSDPSKAQLIHTFKTSGVTILIGDLNDKESLVKAIKQVDVVISTLGYMQIADQVNIIAAIKEAANIKRFFPSEFGDDVDHSRAVDPIKSKFQLKLQIRRAIEEHDIPYTYVVSNLFSRNALSNLLLQNGAPSPSLDKLVIYGDGDVKGVFNVEEDVATYTIKAVDDPRTLNKTLYIKPCKNIYSLNELATSWEKKIGTTLQREYIPEEALLKKIQESAIPVNIILSINHSVFVKGDQTYYEIDPATGVEASELYPDVNYTTVDEFLDQLL